MKEHFVYYAIPIGEEWWEQETHLIVFTSFRKVVWWFLRKARRCDFISIRVVLPADYEQTEKDPCETCLRWDECGGVDRGDCMSY